MAQLTTLQIATFGSDMQEGIAAGIRNFPIHKLVLICYSSDNQKSVYSRLHVISIKETWLLVTIPGSAVKFSPYSHESTITRQKRKKKRFSKSAYLSLMYIVMKIVAANSTIPAMTREEAERFLESKLNLQIATIDEKGEPNIQPVWFYYDKDEGKLLIITSKSAKKTQNLSNRPTIYFSIDDGNPPYKGVKGKGKATIVEDPNRILPQAEKISMKYLGTLDHPAAKEMTDRSKKGEGVLVEISPKFFSTWDFGKKQSL